MAAAEKGGRHGNSTGNCRGMPVRGGGFLMKRSGSTLGNNKGEQGDHSCPFDVNGQFALMFRAVPRDSSRHDFSALGHEILQG